VSDGPTSDQLERAWLWYQAKRDVSRLVARLGETYWADLPWAGKLDDDPYFKDLESAQVERMSKDVLESLDNLAILVLFSAFEAMVRERVIAAVEAEIPVVRHSFSLRAVKDMNASLKKGNFENVLGYCKEIDATVFQNVIGVTQLAKPSRYRLSD
jgi:hypothetical protein